MELVTYLVFTMTNKIICLLMNSFMDLLYPLLRRSYNTLGHRFVGDILSLI